MIQFIIGVIIFCLIACYLFQKNKVVKSQNEYLLANRHTGLFPLIATLVMTEFNTGTLISFSGLGYSVGYWALIMPFIFLLGLFFYAVTVARKWKAFNGVSIAHFFANRYGRSLEVVVAVTMFLAMLGFSAAYIKSITILFLPVFVISSLKLSTIIVVLVLVLTMRGGLNAIITLDIISFVFVLIFFPILIYYSYKLPIQNVMAMPSLKDMQEALPLRFVISLSLITMFSYIIAPWYGQKIVSARNANTAYLGAIVAAIIIFLLYVLGILANCILKSKGVILSNREYGLPYLLYHAIPSSLQVEVYLVLFLITASTLTSVWNAMVTLVVGSIFKNISSNVIIDVMWMIIAAIMSLILANTFIDNILNKMILFNIPIVAFSFALLAGFYWKKSNKVGAYVSIIVGIMWGTFCYLKFGEHGIYTWYWSIYGIPLIFIFGVCGSYFECLRQKMNFFNRCS